MLEFNHNDTEGGGVPTGSGPPNAVGMEDTMMVWIRAQAFQLAVRWMQLTLL